MSIDSLTSTLHWLEDVRDAASLELFQRARTIFEETRQFATLELRARGYFKGAGPHQLSIGVQKEGWFSESFDPTRRFPFDDGCFDAVHAEQTLEHLAYEQACFALRECWRVLKPGGALRVVTLNLAALLALYRPGNFDAVVTINRVMREHRFLFDPSLLEESLREAGFTAIAKLDVGARDSMSFVATRAS